MASADMLKTGGLDALEVLWGANDIGRAIGLSGRQAQYLLKTGRLEGAKKLGHQWCITRQALAANFADGDLSAMKAA